MHLAPAWARLRQAMSLQWQQGWTRLASLVCLRRYLPSEMLSEGFDCPVPKELQTTLVIEGSQSLSLSCFDRSVVSVVFALIRVRHLRTREDMIPVCSSWHAQSELTVNLSNLVIWTQFR